MIYRDYKDFVTPKMKAIFVPFQVGLILRLQLHVHFPGVYYVFF